MLEVYKDDKLVGKIDGGKLISGSERLEKAMKNITIRSGNILPDGTAVEYIKKVNPGDKGYYAALMERLESEGYTLKKV